MTYPSDFEQKIDFNVIRSRLKEKCTYSQAKDMVEQMTFCTDFNRVRLMLTQTQEMVNILNDKSLTYPNENKYDLRDALKRIRIDGLYLDEREVYELKQTLSVVMLEAEFFNRLDKLRFPNISTLAEKCQLGVIKQIFTETDRLLDRYGLIRDNASAGLSRIRKELQNSQGIVSKLLTQILKKAQAEGMVDSDINPTMREGRLVLPVPPAYKKKIGGIVHDESATGKTVFIEPEQVVAANNHIRELENEERREKIRILLAFTAFLRPFVPDVLDSLGFMAQADFIHAKALLAIQLNAIAPLIDNHCLIDLRQAYHPVLYLNFKEQGKQVVPLNLRLDENNRILVISGPNAGGKSVCLKTVALLQYMLQCGLLVPLQEDSHMGIFENMMIDIGDSQSLNDDLSTYSSHLSNMKFFLRHAEQHSLVLIDEFGSGTEPLIGGAIAEAVLRQLNQMQVFGVITTHYTNLKHMAEEVEGIINGAMLYDRGQLKPLFQLSIGQAGSSFALEMAKQIGLPQVIIDQVTQLVGEEKIDYDKHLQDIARDKRYWENKRDKIRQKEKHLDEKIEYYETQISSIKQTKKQMIDEAREQAEELLRRSNATIEKTIKQITESKADKQKTKQARAAVEKLKQEVSAPDEAKRKNKGKTIKEVKAQTNDTKQKKKRVLHDFTELGKLTRGNDKVQIFNSETKQKTTVSDELRKKKLSFQQELDLRGMYADEALQELMNYLDDAVMVGAEEVRILHGTGTGALKQAVRGYLKNQHRVVAFHDGDPDKGGAGITIVEL